MDLYADIGCPACGEPYALYYAGRRRPAGCVAYRYDCPATDATVVYRPTGARDPLSAPRPLPSR